ncbi:50S ribosomal protein L10 [endosymbiont of Pachyrhynchus infernalis]|uniref:50S ribosomal protein L10 n=1 Tax=endosymbiont of Pachyrhynchus infernalis TaxID=1971488 RepID=UPI000DC6EB11|nr:50S ribosomal protein L10 [endosymbiont of Pachyrhynchus infernalis]BBA84824.1 50S ribosomal protein L10 [endosymbiont of Pachyrhynchus infernalis]
MKIKNIEYKKNIVLNLNELLKHKILSLILINPTYLSFNDLIYIRKNVISKKLNLFMIKNSLLKKSIVNTKFNFIEKYANGPNMILYFYEYNIIDYVKKIISFFKNKNLNNIKLIFVENRIFVESKIDYLHNLISFENSIKKIIFILNKISIINLLKIFNFIKKIKHEEEI